MGVDVTLVARFEWLEEAQQPSWWADSPDDPGFFAAAPSLGALQREAEAAIRWAHDDEDVTVAWEYDDVPALVAAISRIESPVGTPHMLVSGQHRRSQTVVIYGFAPPIEPTGEDFHNRNRLLLR